MMRKFERFKDITNDLKQYSLWMCDSSVTFCVTFILELSQRSTEDYPEIHGEYW